jgi:hypothetical protein
MNNLHLGIEDQCDSVPDKILERQDGPNAPEEDCFPEPR